jgi:hypothetical protein
VVVKTTRVRNAMPAWRTREVAAWRPRQRVVMASLQRSALLWHYSQAQSRTDATAHVDVGCTRDYQVDQ